MVLSIMDSFYEKCDKVLVYLKDSPNGLSGSIIPLIKLSELEENTGVVFRDGVINFLVNDKKYIDRHYSGQGQPHFSLSSAGMAFISYSSFVKEQKKIDGEEVFKWYQNENAKQQYDDYPKILRQRNVAYFISIVLALTTIIALVLKFRESQ